MMLLVNAVTVNGNVVNKNLMQVEDQQKASKSVPIVDNLSVD